MEESVLPNQIQSLHFAVARVKEIKTVRNLLLAQNGTKLAFQKLPRHMRRRVMGHSTKRVPKSIKQTHRNQLEKSGLPPKSKRPSRKYRRRPKLLNAEITRRQRVNKWMETHIWHAKRFHMINKWAYKIPYRPTDKAFRACYRATMKHCLLQDISYISCIEVQGKQSSLIEKFKKITKPDEGLSMHAMAYLSGNREGKIMLYKKASQNAIGNVTFNWKPNSEANKATIWLWVHAAYFQEVLDELIALFKLTECISLDEEAKTRQWTSSKVQLTDLQFELNRFRLTGPLSQAILAKALQPVNAALDLEPWFKDWLRDDEQRQLFSEQVSYWNAAKQVQTPSMLSPHIVCSVVVTDPRYNMPNKRTKAVNYGMPPKNVPPPKGVAGGAIWDMKIREECRKSKLTNAAINDLRSQLLVPGSEMEKQGAQVLLMLIQRPGVTKTGFCSGWDVVIPKGWAQCTWLCFIMWGARAGGYRETESVNFELCQQDILPPDTKSGKAENLLQDNQNRTRFFKLPPNKRTNYNKFSAFSPLSCNWSILLHDWGKNSDQIDDFVVLRNRQLLQELQAHLNNRKHVISFPKHEGNYLVPVKITLKRGVVARYTMICLPESAEDIKTPPEEPKRKDTHQLERNKLRKEHQTLLKRLKRKRHINRARNELASVDKSISEKFQHAMRSLWLPPIGPDGLRKSCSREILGFVTQGGVSFANGCSHGVGYIPLNAIMHFLSICKDNKVLCRNNDSRQYRCATLDILQS